MHWNLLNHLQEGPGKRTTGEENGHITESKDPAEMQAGHLAAPPALPVHPQKAPCRKKPLVGFLVGDPVCGGSDAVPTTKWTSDTDVLGCLRGLSALALAPDAPPCSTETESSLQTRGLTAPVLQGVDTLG